MMWCTIGWLVLTWMARVTTLTTCIKIRWVPSSMFNGRGLILHDLMSRHHQWYLLLLWRTQSRNKWEAWNCGTCRNTSLCLMFYGKHCSEQQHLAWGRGLQSPTTLRVPTIFIHDPSGCNFNAGFGWLNGWGFWSLSEHHGSQVISHPLYLGLSQPATTQEQLQAQAKVESSGGFSKRYPIPDDKVHQGEWNRPPFGPRWGKNGFTKVSVEVDNSILLHYFVSQVAAKISQSSTCELSCHRMSPRNLG